MNEKFLKENIIRLVNRNDLTITGVQKVVSFSPKQILLTALDSEIEITGENMQTTKLDENGGELCVNDLITMMKWVSKKEKLPFFKRLFK